MKNIIILALSLFAFSASAQNHTIQWEQGVYYKTVKKWGSALGKVDRQIGAVDSTTYFRKQLGGKDKLHAVRHRDSIIWVPASTDLQKPFTMLIWFHGHWGYDENRTFVDRTLKQIVPKVRNGKNLVLVLPEMPWTVHGTTPTKRNSLIWTKPGQFLAYVEHAKSVLREHNLNFKLGEIDYRIVGHSAGGSTIKRLGITGDLCRLKPSMVVWSDSSYGSWLPNAWNGCLKETNIQVKVFVYKGGSPWRRTTAFFRELGPKPENLTLFVKGKGWSHKKIGDNIVELSGVLEE